jgi:hypothetical protein
MALWAADIDGKWVRETEGKNGKQTQTLTLTSKGTALTGTMEGGRGGGGGGGGGKGGAPMPQEISEGKIDGANVTFKIVRAGRDGTPNTQTYKGTVSATELKLTVEGGGGFGGGKGAPGGPGGPGGGGKGGDGKGGGNQELVFVKAK